LHRLVVIFGITAFLAGSGQALSSPARPSAPGLKFTPSADAYVSSAARRRNFGRAKVLRIGPSTRTYLRFTIGQLDAPVTHATLRLFTRSGTRGFTVRSAGANWSERRITYANAPRPGGLVTSAARQRAGRWIALDVTRLASFAKGSKTVDFALKGAGTTFASRESGSRRPQLIVEATAPTLLAAGDIAYCGTPWDEATAAIVNGIPGTVAALGDLAYDNGTTAEFNACYQPSWGAFKARTKPAPGNHEYGTPGATGYYGYWGAAAGNPAQGWYSYDLGGWHVVSLNSNCPSIGGCGAGSPQEAWLRADLAAHPTRCTAAYWHHPRFSGGDVLSEPDMQPIWQALYDANADLVLTGHAHNYQRFAAQNAAGVADPVRGLREFVVGTGGHPVHHTVLPIANTEVTDATAWGVLKLTLRNSGYDWQFLPIAGQTFTDSGSQACH
jgi:hypothetical protein